MAFRGGGGRGGTFSSGLPSPAPPVSAQPTVVALQEPSFGGPAVYNPFGGAAQTLYGNSTQSSGGLFGSASPCFGSNSTQPSSGLFGGSNPGCGSNSTQSSGGLFGGASPCFGSNSTQPSSGLFGSANSGFGSKTSAQPITSGLFGNVASSNSPNCPAQNNSLFGGCQPGVSGPMFGRKFTQPSLFVGVSCPAHSQNVGGMSSDSSSASTVDTSVSSRSLFGGTNQSPGFASQSATLSSSKSSSRAFDSSQVVSRNQLNNVEPISEATGSIDASHFRKGAEPRTLLRKRAPGFREKIVEHGRERDLDDCAYSNDSGEVNPTSKSTYEKVLAVIELQNFDGSWETSPSLQAILGLEDSRTSSVKWNTMYVVLWLEIVCISEEATWEMVVEKARDWLALNASDFEELEKEVSLLLKPT